MAYETSPICMLVAIRSDKRGELLSSPFLGEFTMIIKYPDDTTARRAALDEMLGRADLSPDMRARIERATSGIDTYLKEEAQIRGELDSLFEASENWAVLHDLLIEQAGMIAHVEHVVINALLQVWVISGGQYAEGLMLSTGGAALSRVGAQRVQRVTPVEEGERVASMLRALMVRPVIRLPSPNGRSVVPEVHSVVVSAQASALLPQGELYQVPALPLAALAMRLSDQLPRQANLAALARRVPVAQLREIAEDVAALHSSRLRERVLNSVVL